MDSGPFRLAPDLAVAEWAKLSLHKQELAEVIRCGSRR
jgi:hypothetical protein